MFHCGLTATYHGNKLNTVVMWLGALNTPRAPTIHNFSYASNQNFISLEKNFVFYCNNACFSNQRNFV